VALCITDGAGVQPQAPAHAHRLWPAAIQLALSCRINDLYPPT